MKFIVVTSSIYLTICRILLMAFTFYSQQMDSYISDCEQKIGHIFKNRHVCWEALQVAGSGITSSGGRVFQKGNQRLAIQGDIVMNLILVTEWYRSSASKGEPLPAWMLSSILSKLPADGSAMRPLGRYPTIGCDKHEPQPCWSSTRAPLVHQGQSTKSCPGFGESDGHGPRSNHRRSLC